MGLFDDEILSIKSAQEAEIYLNRLSQEEFQLLFGDWICQVWLYENEPPNTEEELDKYPPFFGGLYHEFKKSFVNGDYRRVVPGKGVTIDEGIFKSQLETGMLYVSVMDESLGIEPQLAFFKKLPSTLLIQSFSLFMCDPNCIDPMQIDWRVPAYVVDRDVFHYVHVRNIPIEFDYVYYDEFWWNGRNGKSFFSPGENSLNTEAELVDRDWNTFRVPYEQFLLCFKGWEMPRSGLLKLHDIIRSYQSDSEISVRFPDLAREIAKYDASQLLN